MVTQREGGIGQQRQVTELAAAVLNRHLEQRCSGIDDRELSMYTFQVLPHLRIDSHSHAAGYDGIGSSHIFC
jgi:hypothetical protein